MKISLAGWSLSRWFRAEQNKLALVDFPKVTKETFGLDAVELNSPFFESREPAYLDKLMAAAKKAGVKLLNIAVDEKGDLASEDPAIVEEGLRCYGQWIPVAKHLGCREIRCNSGGKNISNREDAIQRCTESFKRLAEQGQKAGVTIMMENHWGISADPDVVARIMQAVVQSVGRQWIATLPDFGNFPPETDRYEGLRKMMPWARAVHAKTLEFDAQGQHLTFDLRRCVQIVKDAGYDGYLGIEAEGKGDQTQNVKWAVAALTPLL